jgi:hypothetical protein
MEGVMSKRGSMSLWHRLRVKLLLLLAGRCGVIVNVRIAGDKLTGMDDRPLLLLNCALGGPDQQAWWGGPAAPWAQRRGPDVRLEWPPLEDSRDDR